MYSLVLVGCGATGSNIATFISQLAISEKKIDEIVLVDGDLVEAKNFRNQKFTKRDVGENKAKVLSRRFSKLGINISYIDKYVDDEKELIKILSSCISQPILVGAVDNNKCRKFMHFAFQSEEIPTLVYIDTGNGDINHVGQTVMGVKVNNKIVRPDVGIYYPIILEEEDDKEKKDYKCSEIEEHPQSFATNVLSATTTFLMINNLINQVNSNTFVNFDADKILLQRS